MREKDSFYIPTIIAIFLIIYLMNAFTPLLADDYCYTYVGGMTEEKVKTFKDLFYSAEFLYKNWSGRVIYLFIAQFFLLIGKEWFNVFNSIVYVGVIYLVYLHAVGIHKKKAGLFAMGNILIWFFTPRFGQNMLWLTGAANYLYPIASILLLLLPYRLSILDEFSEPKGKNIFGIGMFILGILGGAGIENASGAAVLSCVLFLFYIKFVQKKKIDTWMKMGLLGVVMGYMFLLLAPGNYARAALIQDNRNIIYIIFERFVYATNMLKYSLGVWAIILFFVVLPIVLWQKNKKDSLIVCMYLVSALACNYAMVLSPTYPPRSFLGTTVFLSIGILYGIHIYIDEKKNLVSLAIAFALLLLEFIPAIYDIYNINFKSNEREEYILREKENGNYDISLYPIASYNKYNAIYDLEDISEDTNHYINATISKYYGLEKVRKAE